MHPLPTTFCHTLHCICKKEGSKDGIHTEKHCSRYFTSVHRLWDVAAQRPLRKLVGHTSGVTGVSITQDGDACVSCSTDCTIKLWKVPFAPGEAGPLLQTERPLLEFQGKGAFRGIDHHWGRNSFATAGPQVDVWDHERSEPVNSFTWGADSIMSVRFNPVSFVHSILSILSVC